MNTTATSLSGAFDVSSLSARHIFGVLFGLVALILSVDVSTNQSLFVQGAVILLSWASCLLSVWDPRRGLGGASTLYVLVFGVFHCGLVVAMMIDPEKAMVGGSDNSWIRASVLGPALVPVAMSFHCLAISTIAVRVFASKRYLREQARDARTDTISVAIAGLVALSLGLTLIVYSASQAGGLVVLFVGYEQFIETLGDAGIFGYGVILTGFGICFLISSDYWFRYIGWCALCIVVVVALPLGLRGTVFFLLAMILVLGVKKTRIPSLLLIFAAYLLLAIISLLRETRSNGVTGLLGSGTKTFVPLEGLAELGYSLYPTVVVQDWLASGVASMNGITFFAPLIRAIESLFGYGVAADSDPRIFNVEIAQMAGQIGGSPVAEGLRNGGVIGVMVVMLIVGCIVAFADCLPGSSFYRALSSVLLLPLFIGVRNSFAPVMTQWLIGSILLLFVLLISRVRTRDHGL